MAKVIATQKTAQPKTETKVEKKEAVVENSLCYVLPDIKKFSGLRKRQDLGEIEELQNSIAAVGLTTPIGILKDEKGRMFYVTGERRLAAINKLKTDSPGKFNKWFKNGIPATVVATDLLNARLVQMAENGGRKDYTVLELIEDVLASEADGASTKQISQAIGKSETYIRNIKRFDKEASSALKKSVCDGSVTFTDALVLMKQKEEDQEEIADEIAETKKLPRKEKEAAKRKIKAKAQKSAGASTNSTRPTKTECEKAAEALLVEAFSKDSPVKVFTRSQVFYAVGKALEFAAGTLNEEEFADVMEGIIISFNEAKKSYAG